MLKKEWKLTLVVCLVCLFFGGISVLASWPNAPLNENEGGWLGQMFNFTESGTGKLVVKGKVVAENPTENKDLATKEYVDSKVSAAGSSVSWAGYSEATKGGFGYLPNGTNTLSTNQKGVIRGHLICQNKYPNSHWCSFDEIMQLGTKYPYSHDAWLYDGVIAAWGTDTYTSGWYFKDGGKMDVNGLNTDGTTNCNKWTDSGIYYGEILSYYNNNIALVKCDKTAYIPCCK